MRAESDLDGTRQAFAAACDALGRENVHQASLRFAEYPVSLQVAGSDLAEILYRCFEPLVDASATFQRPALSIRAWDRSATGIGCPGIARAPDITNVLGPGLMSQFNNGRVLRYERAEIVKCFDRTSSELFICLRDARRMRLNDRTKPFPHFLATWYRDRGMLLLHAGAVSRKGCGILIGGGGGSGKSTCTIACAFAGFDCLGDDTVGIALKANDTVAYACYNAFRCGARNLSWFPELHSMSVAPTDPTDNNKSLVYLSDISSGRIASRSSVAAIVCPNIGGTGASRLVPTSKAEALRRLAPSTLLRGLGAGPSGFADIAELTRRLPCYELQLGSTSYDVPELIDQLLNKIGR